MPPASGLHLQDTPRTTRHTLSVLVENKPGVLARVAALFSRRGFNIESLAVGPTESPEMSRITLQVNVEEVILEQIIKQLNKLIEVLKIVELEESAIRRELILVKVRATAETRGQLIEIERAALAPLEEGEYYHADLIGLPCEDSTGAAVGTVAAVENYGAGDLLEVERPDGKRSLIPFKDGIADLTDGRIVLDPDFLA